MTTTPEENLPRNEILARYLEMYNQELSGVIDFQGQSNRLAFSAWEKDLLAFLEQQLPWLIPYYRAAFHHSEVSYYFGNPVFRNSGAFDRFLWVAALAVRNEDPSYMDDEDRFTNVTRAEAAMKNRIFIGHGRSSVWRDLKDFLQDRLKLEWDEFNRESTAGISTVERLETMLKHASFAFLVLTAEDEHSDGTVHARENVVHETGLFQGHLGFRRAILMVEEGCKEFSNIAGLTQIRFPRGDISAKFEEVRRVLEREGILS